MMNDIITNETVLDKYNKAHHALLDCMDSALYEIWEYSKAGSTVAQGFMHSKLRDKLVQFELDFQNASIPELNAWATYGAYKAIMSEVIPILINLRNAA